jgi:hypothetical protein
VAVHDAHAMDDEKYSGGDQYCEQERHDSVHELVRGACAKDRYVADSGPRECDSAVGRRIEVALCGFVRSTPLSFLKMIENVPMASAVITPSTCFESPVQKVHCSNPDIVHLIASME